MSNYMYCFVPECRNTSIFTPNKIFINVPTDIKLRKLWLKAARRNIKDVSVKSHLYCCEDHFNLQEDMENYLEFKMMGAKKRMKKNILPHIFECQFDKKHTAPKPLRSVYVKRAKLNTIGESMSQPSTSQHGLEMETEVVPQPSTSKQGLIEELQLQTETVLCAARISSTVCEARKTREIGVNVNLRPSFRSKAVMCNILPTTVNVACSPVKQLSTQIINYSKSKLDCTSSEDDSAKNITVSSGSSYIITSKTDSDVCGDTEDIKSLAVKLTNISIKNKPKMYLGMTKSWYDSGFINLLSQETNLPVRNIHLTLLKIKLNDSFERLGDMFGISESMASRIFNKSVTSLSESLKQLIYWPDSDSITKLLPIPFRYKFNNVQSIIDCLEIEISKPSDPIQQSLTWSEYMKCNTLKYMISSTPDGFINFVSEGYGGRITDVQLVEQSTNYLCILPEGCGVLADRGFKGILPLIKKKNCHLMKPPSVSAGTRFTKEEVLLTKSIASLRIHIERVIRRLREYEILKPHSVVHNSLIPIIDKIVVIAAALINLQLLIIRQ